MRKGTDLSILMLSIWVYKCPLFWNAFLGCCCCFHFCPLRFFIKYADSTHVVRPCGVFETEVHYTHNDKTRTCHMRKKNDYDFFFFQWNVWLERKVWTYKWFGILKEKKKAFHFNVKKSRWNLSSRSILNSKMRTMFELNDEAWTSCLAMCPLVWWALRQFHKWHHWHLLESCFSTRVTVKPPWSSLIAVQCVLGHNVRVLGSEWAFFDVGEAMCVWCRR